MAQKKLRFMSVILSVICVVFVAEAAAPAAAIGNQQFFWWFFLIITFLMPYGMFVAELGTTYDSDGGLYDWIRDAFGDRWAARVSWYYWLNFPLWMASLATMVPDIIDFAFGTSLSGSVWGFVVELAFVWGVTVMAFSKVSDADWVLNGGAILKVAIAVAVGCLGLWYASSHGFANDMSFHSFLPDMGGSLGYLSIILFNFMGFEVVCTFAGDMADPQKDIPKAIILGGIAIAAIYLFSGFGIGAAMPADGIDPDYGMIFAVRTMVGDSILFKLLCVVFLVTLFANMASWSFGVNSVACIAAQHGNMPAVFARVNEKTEMPNGAAIVNGAVATLALCLQLVPVEAISEGVFWLLFSSNVVFLLLSYIPMFPALTRLRQVDPDRPRVYRFPLEGPLLTICVAVPVIELVLCCIATVAPPFNDGSWKMVIAVAAGVVVGEIVRVVAARGRAEEYHGLTPDAAARRLAEEAGVEK